MQSYQYLADRDPLTRAVMDRMLAGVSTRKCARVGEPVGLGVETVKWPRPVYPGDALRIVITITGKRHSQSKPTHGIVQYKVDTFNQQDELVMEMTTAVLVPR